MDLQDTPPPQTTVDKIKCSWAKRKGFFGYLHVLKEYFGWNLFGKLKIALNILRVFWTPSLP